MTKNDNNFGSFTLRLMLYAFCNSSSFWIQAEFLRKMKSKLTRADILKTRLPALLFFSLTPAHTHLVSCNIGQALTLVLSLFQRQAHTCSLKADSGGSITRGQRGEGRFFGIATGGRNITSYQIPFFQQAYRTQRTKLNFIQN